MPLRLVLPMVIIGAADTGSPFMRRELGYVITISMTGANTSMPSANIDEVVAEHRRPPITSHRGRCTSGSFSTGKLGFRPWMMSDDVRRHHVLRKIFSPLTHKYHTPIVPSVNGTDIAKKSQAFCAYPSFVSPEGVSICFTN